MQINGDLKKKSTKTPKPNQNQPKNKQTKQKTLYIGQGLEWLEGQDLLFWLNLLQALGIS